MNHPLKKTVAQRAHQRLLLALMKPWRKQGRSLLLIGMESGLTADFLWESGMDVTVIDENAIDPQKFPFLSPKMEIVRGDHCDLPFEDRCFDYALLNHQYAAGSARQKDCMIGEAMRVAQHGLILLEWNRMRSITFSSDSMRQPSAVWPCELARAVRRQCPGMETAWLSTLLTGDAGGQGSLPATFLTPLKRLNMSCTSLPVGALMGVRIQWKDAPLNPLGMLRRATSALTAGAQEEEVFGRDITAFAVDCKTSDEQH